MYFTLKCFLVLTESLKHNLHLSLFFVIDLTQWFRIWYILYSSIYYTFQIMAVISISYTQKPHPSQHVKTNTIISREKEWGRHLPPSPACHLPLYLGLGPHAGRTCIAYLTLGTQGKEGCLVMLLFSSYDLFCCYISFVSLSFIFG